MNQLDICFSKSLLETEKEIIQPSYPAVLQPLV